MPRKNPTAKEVGNRFKTKVPKTASAKCTMPEKIVAINKALLPLADCLFKLITVQCEWEGAYYNDSHHNNTMLLTLDDAHNKVAQDK